MSLGRVLLVEDEGSLRQLLAKYLTRLGYQVDAAESAEEALTLLDPGPSGHLLVLADLTLPGMPGDELMSRALAANPSIRVLLSSGYPYDLSALPAGQRQRAGFLQKPYVPSQLIAEINRLLANGKSASA